MATDLQNDVATTLTVKALAALIAQAIGSAPIVQDKGDHYLVTWTPDQRLKLQSMIYDSIRPGAPGGKIRFDLSVAVAPVVRAYGLAATGVSALLVSLGYLIPHKGRR